MSQEERRQSKGESHSAIRALRFAIAGVRLLWLQLGITLLLVLLLELMARVYVYGVGANRYEDPRVHADAYTNAPWSKEVLREYNGKTVHWHPYVYWIGGQYDSRYTHVDRNGIRATWRNPAARSTCQRPLRIFMFGGSTMWGEGARDDYTIPSWLQRMLADHVSCAEIANFGQDGYVSTQEWMLLADQLRRENIPNLAIFYDGYNDAHSAALNDAPGLTYDESARRREFNIGNLVTPGKFGRLTAQWSVLARTSLSQVVNSLGLGWFARRVIATWSPRSYIEVNGILVRRPSPTWATAGNDALAEATARNYLTNVRIEQSMGREFGFRCLFYWQPWLADKYQLTSYEHRQMDDLLPGLREFVQAVRKRVVEDSPGSGIHFLNDVFNDTSEPYFIDEVHISEDGNRRIAERILPDVLAVTEQINAEAQVREGGRRESARYAKCP